MYAVIATGGKQYKVEPGRTYRFEKLPVTEGAPVVFDKVLLFSDGDTLTIGQPWVENVNVQGRVVEQNKAKKIIVFKYKRRKGYRRKQGHRQPFTAVAIETIGMAEAPPEIAEPFTEPVAEPVVSGSEDQAA